MAAISHPIFWSRALIEITLKDLTPEEIQSAPRTLKALIRMTSEDEALALCERFGGLDMLIPVSDSDRARMTEFRGELRSILSESSYDRFLAEWGNTKFPFPRLNGIKVKRRDRLIVERIDLSFARNESMAKAIREIVRDFGIHRRHVYRILKKPISSGGGTAKPSNAPTRLRNALPSAATGAKLAGQKNGHGAFAALAGSLSPEQPESRAGSMRGLRKFLEGADKT
ncbi:MAG: hypothetical protein EPN61_14880 [Burkholderiaceae bacterium]|nr:MAG: hypothetical protein EPN61_14880 [Burkholderiaceae bacterium]